MKHIAELEQKLLKNLTIDIPRIIYECPQNADLTSLTLLISSLAHANRDVREVRKDMAAWESGVK